MVSVRRISVLAVLLATLILVLTFASLGGFSAVTLPWLTANIAFLSAAIIIGIHGRILLPLILGKFVRINFGSYYIKDKYVIIPNPDYEDPSARYAGYSVIKIIPTIPVTDLEEKEKLQLISQLESLFLSMPYDVEFCIMKVVDPKIHRLINEIEKEIAKYEIKAARAKNAARFERKISELREEKRRILQSRPVSAVIYFKVNACGRTEAEVIERLNVAIAQIDALKTALQANIMVLNMVDLEEFIRLRNEGFGGMKCGAQ